MKRLASILLFLFLSFGAFASKPKVIENPSYEVKNTGLFNVAKIVLTDTSTRVYIHITFIPKWWVLLNQKEIKIKDSNTGKLFPVRGIEGAEFDKKLSMPKSGDSTIVLIFPGLDKTTTKIDIVSYSESNVGEAIYGISLTNKKNTSVNNSNAVPEPVTTWLNHCLANNTKMPLVDYNAALFVKPDTARLVGYIKGYDPRLGFSTGIIYTGNVFTKEEFPIVMQIYPDGRFEAKILTDMPVYSSVFLQKQWIPFYLEPGQTLSMIINWDEFLLADRFRNVKYQFKNTIYDGPLAKINSELNSFPKIQFNSKEFQKEVSTLSPQAYTKVQNEALNQNLMKLDSFINKNSISSKASLILKNQIYIENANQRFYFLQSRSNNAIKDTSNSVLKIAASNDYYDFLQKLPLDDQSLCVINDFSVFINRFEYCDPFNSCYFRKKLYNFKTNNTDLCRCYLKDSVLQNVLHLAPNFTYEVSKIRTLSSIKNMSKDYAHEYWDSLKLGIRNSYLIKTGDEYLAKLFPENSYQSYVLPNGHATDVFKKIIDPFKGKILFIDFWATTCAPCVAGIKRMQPVRQKYLDNPDFDFIFITDEKNSSEEDYKKFVSNQELKNTFRISNDDFNYLRQLFKFNGIPQYVVIDKNGDVLNDEFQMYNFENELTKVLSIK
jgi:thiol-disulfide isomerase/thioredoxin